MQFQLKNRAANVVAALAVIAQPGGVKKTAVAIGQSMKANRRMTAVMIAAGSVQAFAADGDMVVTGVLATIAGAVVAKNTIGPAWTGLKYIGKAWAKL
jgi:hypothetical protein